MKYNENQVKSDIIHNFYNFLEEKHVIFTIKVNGNFLSVTKKYEYLYNFFEIINSIIKIIYHEINDNKMYYCVLEVTETNKIICIFTFPIIKEIEL